MSESVTFLPATGHAFWVAYLEEDDVRTSKDAEELVSMITVEPVVGWMVTRDPEDGEVRAHPLAPYGPIMPGTSRWLDSDHGAALAQAKESALDKFERFQSSQLAGVAGQRPVPAQPGQ